MSLGQALSGFQIAGTIGSAEQEAQARRYQGDFQKLQNESNARIAEVQAEDALARGDENVQRFKEQINQLLGKQRAALAASGVELGSGSAFQIQEDTMRRADLDALQIKNNAAREAWGFRVQATNFQTAGSIAQTSAQFASGQILTAGYSKAFEQAAGAIGEAAKTAATGGVA